MTIHKTPYIVVLDDYERALRSLADWSEIDRLAKVEIHHDPLRGDALHAALVDADAVVLVRDRTPFRAELIERLPKLRYLVFTGARNAALDTAALNARGIPVSHTDWGPSKESTCELTWALILAASKRLEAKFAVMRAGGWRDDQPLPSVLAGERMGLIGLGEIGGRVARVAGAFGMQVVAWSPRMTPERAAEKGATAVSLEELLTSIQSRQPASGADRSNAQAVERRAVSADANRCHSGQHVALRADRYAVVAGGIARRSASDGGARRLRRGAHWRPIIRCVHSRMSC